VILAMSKALGFEPSGNSRGNSKSFSISLTFGRSRAKAEAEKKKMSLSNVKLKVELCIQDIDNQDADRLRYKIRSTREVKDLWMLRSDIHQLISRHVSQQEAAKRINDLLPCFEHWMPAKSLLKI
jgi:ERCC4-type nuclease